MLGGVIHLASSPLRAPVYLVRITVRMPSCVSGYSCIAFGVGVFDVAVARVVIDVVVVAFDIAVVDGLVGVVVVMVGVRGS